ncbi:putative poliovirus receptor-related protein 3-like [Triplophysa rosa]|uniref:Poliovirus receptor-related protein 3-like n=1 Tax=Triplophysa rosa TaxID=992332 RepID=A0A9W7WQC0_TRIRA|nr:putative poliovirus receptor-related protein 3-like [Triplophysa rosa]
MMDANSKLIFLLLSCTTFFAVLRGQRVDTDGEVIGYQNHNVTLPCHYILGKTEDNLIQVQWTWQNHSHKHDPIVIIINHQEYGTSVYKTSLKERVSFIERPKLTPDGSIIIKDVKITDQGVYSCVYTTYPSGTKTGVTTLKVKEGMAQNPGDLQQEEVMELMEDSEYTMVTFSAWSGVLKKAPVSWHLMYTQQSVDL